MPVAANTGPLQSAANSFGVGNPLANNPYSMGFGSANPYGQNPGQIQTGASDQDRMQQMALLRQLQGMAAGTGPSAVQATLNQATGANLSQAMALGAAQQGQGVGYAGALRNIGDQRAAIQQGSANQAALLKAQEQQMGIAQLGGVESGMRSQDIGLAEQQAGNNLNLYQGNQQNQLGYDTLNAGINNNNTQNMMTGMKAVAGGISGIGQGLGSMATTPAAPAAAAAPEILSLAEGGRVPLPSIHPHADDVPFGEMAGDMAAGSKYEQTHPPPSDAAQASRPTPTPQHQTLASGGATVLPFPGLRMVPGRAAHGGDNEGNDTVPAMLSPGEVVLPRSVVNSDRPEHQVKAFLDAVKAGHGPAPTFEDVLVSHRHMLQRMDEIEKRYRGGKVASR